MSANGFRAFIRRWGMSLVALVVFGLLLSHVDKIDWVGAWQALRRYEPTLLLQALALTTASHMLYGCFDLIGRKHTGHQLPRLQTWCIAMTSYAFTLNLGSMIGSVGARLRLYTRAGLDEVTIAQIVAASVSTNWMGYGLVAGGLFAFGAISLPPQARVSATALEAIGIGMMLLAGAYVLACAVARQRSWQVGGRKVRAPSPRLAVLQLATAATNWATMGAAMYLLLGAKVPYPTTLAVLMAASIIGVLAPIPAGLGLLEAVYLMLLSGTVPQDTLMGALLAYRALYYLLPLAGGLLLYFGLESALGRRSASGRRPLEGPAKKSRSPSDASTQPATGERCDAQ
jgi:glycosyltransferase 2 family protein